MAQFIQRGTAFAKTTRPVIGSAVRREALFARLDGGPGRTAVWIHGPPGAGKSTLAASYVEARNRQCVWYQVDPDDADVATFFHYLRHAARKLGAARARDLPAFGAQQPADIGSFARTFFRAMFARAKTPTVVVFDNLPEHSGNDLLHAAIAAGLAEIPQHCCVLITSRSGPPASLARMQASGALVCVGGHELRFGAADLVEIARLRGMPLDASTAQSLERRTEGWIAGIVLLLEHAKLTGGLADLPEGAAPQVVFDYLAGEIFDRFDPATRQFLTRVARLPRISAEIAEILSGEARAGRLLRNLAHNDYFVREVRAESGLLYELHPLLRGFLRERLQDAQPDAAASERLERAAEALHESGQCEDAVELLAESAHWDGIARVIAGEATVMLAQGRGEVLNRWIELLPKKRLEQDPHLLQSSGLCLLSRSPRSARRRLEQAFEAFRARNDQAAMTASCLGIVESILREFDDLAALDPWIEKLDAHLRARPSAGADRLDAAALTTLIAALAARNPGHAALAPCLDAAKHVAGDQGDAAHGQLLGVTALAQLARGSTIVLPAASADRDASSAATDRDAGLLPARSLHQLLDGDYRAAREIAEQGFTAAAPEGRRSHNVWLTAIAVIASLGLNDAASARARIQSLQAGTPLMRRGDRALLHWLNSQLAFHDSDVATAQRELRAALTLATETGSPWLEFLAHIGNAQLLSAAGERRTAEAALRSAATVGETLACARLDLTLDVCRAMIALQAGDPNAARTALHTALALGRTHGFRHAPAIAANALARVCAFALQEQLEPDYVRSLIHFSKLAPPPNAALLSRWPWRFRIWTCGNFTIRQGDVPIEFSGKGPGRPIELLKVLIALGGRTVRADQIADALWPRVDADYAHKSLTIALHRLRRLLAEDDALQLRDGRLSLNSRLCWVDLWALDARLDALDETLRDPSPQAAHTARRTLLEVCELYPGPFLAGDSEHAAYITCRERIRARVARVLARLVRRATGPHDFETVEESYLRLLEADQLCESFHRGLMQCYHRSGNRVEALATFERLRTLLATRLGSSPSPETQAAYAELLGQT